MTIILTPAVEARLRENAEQEGTERSATAEALILVGLQWETPDAADAAQGIQRGPDDFQPGRCRPFQEFADHQRRKLKLSRCGWSRPA